MNRDDEKFEELVRKTLELLSSGKSPEEILNLLPEERHRLNEVFNIISTIKKEREEIAPSPELLKKILNLAGERVTESENTRYLYSEEEKLQRFKGRPSHEFITTGVPESMTNKWKIRLPLGIGALAVLVLAVTWFSGRQTAPFDLAEIDRTQQALVALGDEMDQYAAEDASLDEIDSALDEAATEEKPLQTTSPAQAKDYFNLSAIESESQKVGFDSELEMFFLEENSLNEVDSALADF